MGRSIGAEIQASAQSPALGIRCAEHHAAHARLDQGARTHWARLKGDQQGVLIESPVTAQAAGLAEGHKLRMPEGILCSFASVAAPANGSTAWIEHDCRHRHFAPLPRLGGQPQQAIHPPLIEGFHQQ